MPQTHATKPKPGATDDKAPKPPQSTTKSKAAAADGFAAQAAALAPEAGGGRAKGDKAKGDGAEKIKQIKVAGHDTKARWAQRAGDTVTLETDEAQVEFLLREYMVTGRAVDIVIVHADNSEEVYKAGLVMTVDGSTDRELGRRQATVELSLPAARQ